MTDFLVELFIRILNMSISAVFLIAAVLVLRLLLRRAPRWIAPLLWGIVGIRLLLPFSVESVFSLIPSAETISPEIVYDATPTIHSGIYAVNSAVNPVLNTSFAPAPGDSVHPLQVWFLVGAVIWCVGVLAMLGYLIISYRRLSRHVRDAAGLETGICESDRVETPFVLGFFRPRIYLPQGLPEAEAVHVIAHEREHIRRRDHFIKPIGFVLLSMHWFNPLLWVAYVLLCRDIEIACDERVIRDMEASARADYSEALLSCSIPRRRIAACPLAFGEVGVRTRVKHVLHYKKPAFWLILVAVLAGIIVAVCFLTDPIPPASVDIDAHAYAVAETVYQHPASSVVLVPWEDGAYYSVTEYMDLLKKDRADTNEGWYPLGRLTEFQLTKSNFDDCFFDIGWADGCSASQLRRSTVAAWRFSDEQDEVWYYLLQTENGELYLAEGRGTMLYWLVRLKKDITEDTGMIALSGGQSVPVVCCRADTPLSEIRGLPLYTLEIAPDADDTVPFQLFCDGREQYGYFSVYDAETLQPLDFLRPSGLSPQTYIFQNAQYGRKYIVTMRTASSDYYAGDLWCFIAAIPDEDAVGLSFDTFYAYAGYSETAHSVMSVDAVNRDSDRYGNAHLLTPLAVLDSRAALDGFMDRMSAYCTLTEGWDEVGSFTEQTAAMDDAFFAENTLLAAYILDTSTSYRHAVEEIWETDGKLEIRIRRITRTAADEMMAGWFLGVIVPKDFLAAVTDYDAYICAEVLAEEDREIVPLAGYYVFTESESVIKPAVALFEDGTFSFTFSAHSSYIGIGTYELTDDRLILHTDDGNYVYEFWVIGDSIVFDALSSSTQLWGAKLYHCAVLS